MSAGIRHLFPYANSIWLCLCLLLGGVHSGVVLAQEPADSRLAIPSAERQKSIRTQLDETLGLTKATNTLKKSQALKDLMMIAGDPATSGEELYVVLQVALPLIRERSDLPALRTTVQKLTDKFQLDPINEQAKQLEEFIAACKSSSTLDQAVKDVVALVELANGENRFADAKRSLDFADSAAKKLNSKNSITLLTESRKLVEERDKAFADQRKGQQTLKSAPDDPQANFLVGKTMAVFEAQWETALPHLAKGSDAKWQAAAKAELAVTKEVDSRLKVVDAWWDVAEAATGTAKTEVQLRTYEMYAEVEANVISPVSKRRVTDRKTSLAKILKIQPTEPERKPAAEIATKPADKNELPIGKAIDLLEMVKLPDHVVLGNWNRLDGAIVCEASSDARFMTPIVVAGSYQLTCTFTRRTGKDEVALILPVGETCVELLVDSCGGTVSGLAQVDGRFAIQLVGTPAAVGKNGPLANGVPHELQVTVSQQGQNVAIKAAVDGDRLISWKGSVSQLSIAGFYAVPNPHAFGVLAHNSIVDVHELKLELKRGSRGFRLGEDWKNPLFVVADKPRSDVAKRCLTWGGKKYFISDKPLSLPNAQLLATQLEGRLFTISSAEEQTFIFEQARGLRLWMAGWRPPQGILHWRDERNRPLRHLGSWGPSEPDHAEGIQWQLCIWTDKVAPGWHDVQTSWGGLHACIEWGEEYPEDLEAKDK